MTRRCMKAVLRHAAKLWLRPQVQRQAEGHRCPLQLPAPPPTSQFFLFFVFIQTLYDHLAHDERSAPSPKELLSGMAATSRALSTDAAPTRSRVTSATELQKTRKSTGLTDVLYSNLAQQISPAKGNDENRYYT